MTRPGEEQGRRKLTRIGFATWLALVGALGTSAPVAQAGEVVGSKEGQTGACRFVLRHEEELTLSDGGKPTVLVAGGVSKPLVLNSSDGPQCVRLENQNPVLFRYAWKQETKTRSENYEAALAFAGALEKLTAGLKPVIERENAEVFIANSALNKKLPGQGVALTHRVTANKRRLSQGAQADKALVTGLEDALREPAVRSRLEVELALELAGIDDSPVFLAEVEKRLSALQACLTAMGREIQKLSSGGRPSPGDFCTDSQPENLEANLTKDFEKIDAGQAQLLKMAMRDEQGIANQPFFVASTLLQFQRQKVLEGARKVGTFKRQLTEMQRALRLGTVAYLPREDQVWALRIERVDENAPGTTVSQIAGDFKLRFVPYSPVRLGLGAAAIYSFVSDAKYTTQPVDGGFRIVESPDQKQYQEGGIAAVLTITPRGWTDPTFGGFFEVGVQPTDDLGLIAGAGIRLFDIASFGAGIAFQQVDVLSPGLSLGDTIAAESDLKTAKRFKAGVYLHITLSIDVKK